MATNTVSTQEDPVLLCKTTSTPQTVTSIESLPDEILDYIFSFLDFVQRSRIEEVCRRWCMIGGRPTRLRLDLDYIHNHQLDDSVLCSILSRRGPTLTQLILKSNTDLTCDSLKKIGEFCPNLVALELHLLGYRQMSCLKAIASCCPNLKELKLKNNDKVDDDTYNNGLYALVQSCTTLEALRVSHVSRIAVKWLKFLSPNLHSLYLYRSGLTSEGMLCLMNRCPALAEFTLDGCNLWDPLVLFEFLKNYRRTLTVLRITYEFYWDLDWRGTLRELINIEVLQLFCCDLVDDALMEVIANNCVKLRVLDIGFTEVTDIGIIALKRLPALKELRIDQRTKVTGNGIESLVTQKVLQYVTIPPYDPGLIEACQKISLSHGYFRFVIGKENDWTYWGESRPKRVM